MATRVHQHTAQREHRRAVLARLRYGVEVEPVGWCDHAWLEDGLPTFRWRSAPAGFVTRRQLRELDLAPGGHDPVAAMRRAPGRRLVAYLYRLDLAVDRRRPTPAQLAAVAKALAARRTCPTCNVDQGFCLPRSLGECWPCWEDRETARQARNHPPAEVTIPAPRAAPDTAAPAERVGTEPEPERCYRSTGRSEQMQARPVAVVRHGLDADEIRGRTRPVTTSHDALTLPRHTDEPVDGAIRRAQHTLATVERVRQAEQARVQQQARWHTGELLGIATADNARSEVAR